MTFHECLVIRRRELNISIRKICRDLGVPKSTYEGWEIDSFPRKPMQYQRLADYLKVSVEYLMFGTNQRREMTEALVYLERFVRAVIKEEVRKEAAEKKGAVSKDSLSFLHR